MATPNPDWRAWRAFFTARRHRPRARLLAHDSQLEGIPRTVARSLAIFQLGESGGGTVVEQAQRCRLPSVDADYAAAVELFVAEEHRHAELLACCVRALRGRLIRGNWTHRLFVAGRRLVGLRLKIMVLLAAEVVGICYYQLLAAALPRSELKSVLHEIVADEKAHLRFHCDFLRTQFPAGPKRRLFVPAWRLLMLAAGVVVLFDHRAALRDLHIPLERIWRRWSACSRAAEVRITSCDSRPQRECTVRCTGRSSAA